MRKSLGCLVMVLVAGLATVSVRAQGPAAAPAPPSNDWLLNAPSDGERFRLLQRYLRGFDQPMWEVGERYEGLYEALQRKNYDLAVYHWEKIRTTIENGYLKRPARKANADAVFLSKVWGEVDAALRTKDSAKAWVGFTTGRAACQACHQEEAVGYMNNQPMFDKMAPRR